MATDSSKVTRLSVAATIMGDHWPSNEFLGERPTVFGEVLRSTSSPNGLSSEKRSTEPTIHPGKVGGRNHGHLLGGDSYRNTFSQYIYQILYRM